MVLIKQRTITCLVMACSFATDAADDGAHFHPKAKPLSNYAIEI